MPKEHRWDHADRGRDQDHRMNDDRHGDNDRPRGKPLPRSKYPTDWNHWLDSQDRPPEDQAE